MNPSQMMPPDLKVFSSDLKADIFSSLYCTMPGKISKVNDNQTVSVELQIKRALEDGTSQFYPLLVDCPYFVLQGGGAYLDMPIAAGDGCLVLFSDRDIDTWWATGNVTDPPTTRKHSLADGFALVGFNAKPNALARDGTAVRLLGTSGPGSEKEAARKADAIQSVAADDAAFWSWVTTISAAVNALSSGSVPNVPTSLTGKITGGSTEVKIG